MPILKGKITLDSREAKAAVRNLERSVLKFKNNVGVPLMKIGKMASVAGLAMSAMSIASIKSVAKAGDAVDKMSKRTGIATDELSRYSHAADLSGGSIEGLEKTLKKMSTTLYEAKRGTKTYTDALGDLGLSFEDLQDLDPAKRFDLIMTKLAGIEDASMRSALALKIFGRNGIQLLPMLSEGTDGLKAMKAEADRLGIVFSADQANSAARLVDEVTRLKSSFRGLFIQGMGLDGVSDAVSGLTESMIVLRESGAFSKITVAMVTFAEKGVRAINHIIGGLNQMTDAERDSLKNAGLVFAGITVAFKAGLLIPVTRGLVTLVANVATASATIATILAGLGAFVAGYNIGAILDSKFSVGAWLAKKEIEVRLANAKLRDKIKLEGLGPMDVGAVRYNAALKETEDVDFLKLWLKNQTESNDAAALEAKGKSMSEHYISGLTKGVSAIAPDSFKHLFSAADKLINADIPDLPELTKSSAFAAAMGEASDYAENVARMLAPIRGFMTGGLSINHAIQNTDSRKREEQRDKHVTEVPKKIDKTNELLREVVGEIQRRGSFSFSF